MPVPDPKTLVHKKLRARLTYSEWQLAIYKSKAASEEMRAEKLLAQHETDVDKIARLTERVGELFGKVLLRDEGLVQTVLHFAPHGDPPSTVTAAAAPPERS